MCLTELKLIFTLPACVQANNLFLSSSLFYFKKKEKENVLQKSWNLYFYRKNFENGWEIEGSAFAVFVDGKKVVDLWGGYADKQAARKWAEVDF